MPKKLDQYLAIIIASAIVLGNAAMSFASDDSFSVKVENNVNMTDVVVEEVSGNTEENSQEAADFEDGETGKESADFENGESTNITETADDKAKKQEEFLGRLHEELNMTKTNYRQLLSQIAETKERLRLVGEDQMNLEEQLANLDTLVVLTTEKLVNVLRQVVDTENEIMLLEEQIRIKQTALGYQKELLKDYLVIMYQEENNYLSVNENGDVEVFRFLLADGSVGENVRDLDYFLLLNETGQQMLEKLYQLSNELEESKDSLTEKQARLTGLLDELEAEKAQLDIQKDAKQKLLDITKGQEKIYDELLEQTLMEQEQMIQDIKNLSNSLNFVEKKMLEEGENFDPDKYLSLLDYRTQVLYEFKLNYNGNSTFAWPSEPTRGISAYFHDPSYVGVFGVQHNAVDIPAYQGSNLRAAADGVVYTARDNGYGYSYVILAHPDGLMTVYGHVSEILVKEGDIVSQGDVVGLSGGMPGTKGAGYMTTGPHLHFEVLKNGLYVDPLLYLPLEVLTKDQIDRLPEKYYDDWEEAREQDAAVPIERFSRKE